MLAVFWVHLSLSDRICNLLCGCSSCTWATWLCLSYCIAQLITLAQLSTASDIQTVLAHLQVFARASARVPYRTLCIDFLHLGTVSAPLSWWQSAGDTENTNIYVRSWSVFCIWSGSLEHCCLSFATHLSHLTVLGIHWRVRLGSASPRVPLWQFLVNCASCNVCLLSLLLLHRLQKAKARF